MFCNPFFDFASILISFLISLYFGASKKARSFQNRVFIMLNVSNIITAFADVMTYYFCFTKSSMFLCETFTIMYFVTHILIFPLFFLYVLLSIKSWYDYPLYFKILLTIPMIFMWGLVFINRFSNLLYYYSEDFEYHRNPGMYLMYAGTGLYTIWLIIVIFRYRKIYAAAKRTTILFVLLFNIISVFIQFIDVNTRFETFSIAFGGLLLLLTIQDPHDETDYETGLYNKNALNGVLAPVFHSDINHLLVEIVVSDYNDPMKSDDKDSTSIPCQIKDFLKDMMFNFDIYRYEKNVYCLLFQFDDDHVAYDLISQLKKRFEEPWDVQDMKVVLNAKICKFSIPEDADNLALLNGILTECITLDRKNEVITIKDIDKTILDRKLKINSAIDNAIKNDSFELIFTPIYDVAHNKINKAILSFRFLDDEIGYVYAEEILPYLEKYGKLKEVLSKISFKIVDLLMSDSFNELNIQSISLRISSMMTIQSGLLGEMCDMFDEYNVDPHRITFEFTEALVSNLNKNLADFMIKMKEKGYLFVLTEYGSGYSNISAIYDLPIKTIVVDGNIVRSAFENEKAKVALKRTLELGKKLHMNTALSGIIDPKYFEMIKEFHCDFALGSYFLEDLDIKQLKDAVSEFSANQEKIKEVPADA